MSGGYSCTWTTTQAAGGGSGGAPAAADGEDALYEEKRAELVRALGGDIFGRCVDDTALHNGEFPAPCPHDFAALRPREEAEAAAAHFREDEDRRMHALLQRVDALERSTVEAFRRWDDNAAVLDPVQAAGGRTATERLQDKLRVGHAEDAYLAAVRQHAAAEQGLAQRRAWEAEAMLAAPHPEYAVQLPDDVRTRATATPGRRNFSPPQVAAPPDPHGAARGGSGRTSPTRPTARPVGAHVAPPPPRGLAVATIPPLPAGAGVAVPTVPVGVPAAVPLPFAEVPMQPDAGRGVQLKPLRPPAAVCARDLSPVRASVPAGDAPALLETLAPTSPARVHAAAGTSPIRGRGPGVEQGTPPLMPFVVRQPPPVQAVGVPSPPASCTPTRSVFRTLRDPRAGPAEPPASPAANVTVHVHHDHHPPVALQPTLPVGAAAPFPPAGYVPSAELAAKEGQLYEARQAVELLMRQAEAQQAQRFETDTLVAGLQRAVEELTVQLAQARQVEVAHRAHMHHAAAAGDAGHGALLADLQSQVAQLSAALAAPPGSVPSPQPAAAAPPSKRIDPDAVEASGRPEAPNPPSSPQQVTTRAKDVAVLRALPQPLSQAPSAPVHCEGEWLHGGERAQSRLSGAISPSTVLSADALSLRRSRSATPPAVRSTVVHTHGPAAPPSRGPRSAAAAGKKGPAQSVLEKKYLDKLWDEYERELVSGDAALVLSSPPSGHIDAPQQQTPAGPGTLAPFPSFAPHAPAVTPMDGQLQPERHHTDPLAQLELDRRASATLRRASEPLDSLPVVSRRESGVTEGPTWTFHNMPSLAVQPASAEGTQNPPPTAGSAHLERSPSTDTKGLLQAQPQASDYLRPEAHAQTRRLRSTTGMRGRLQADAPSHHGDGDASIKTMPVTPASKAHRSAPATSLAFTSHPATPNSTFGSPGRSPRSDRQAAADWASRVSATRQTSAFPHHRSPAAASALSAEDSVPDGYTSTLL